MIILLKDFPTLPLSKIMNNMINFQAIFKIYSDFLSGSQHDSNYEDNIHQLIFLNIKTNKILWDLEDSARMMELGESHVAKAKKGIDKNNQARNDLIRDIDIEIANRFDVISGSKDKFYSESPGMIIDRLSIIFIKLSVVQKMIPIIEENDLKSEYIEKEKVLMSQIENIGSFLNLYIDRLLRKEVFFEVQQPVKLYNDTRMKKCFRV